MKKFNGAGVTDLPVAAQSGGIKPEQQVIINIAHAAAVVRHQIKEMQRGILIDDGPSTTLRAVAAFLDAALPAPLPTAVEAPHKDDAAVDQFGRMMKVKLSAARAKGRSGWDDPEQCSVQALAMGLREHIAKGDLIDVANFCMMIVERGGNGHVTEIICADRRQPDCSQAVLETPVAARDQIELTDDVREILGRLCFQCIGLAEMLRKMGLAIAEKAEDEQAVVLHWLLNLYLKHGEGWRVEGEKVLRKADAPPPFAILGASK